MFVQAKKNCRQLMIMCALPASAVVAQEAGKSLSQDVWRLINDTTIVCGQGAGAIILLKESTFSVDKKFKTTEVFHIVGKILDQKARLDFAQIPMLFNSYYEDVTVDFARSIRADGSISEVYPDAIMTQSLPQMEGGIRYSDTRALTFSLPGLDVGVAFEYQVTIKQKRPVMAGAWFMDHAFGYILRRLAAPFAVRMDPVAYSRLRVHIPHGARFRWNMKLDSLPPAVTPGKKVDEYLWELHDLPEIKFEGGMPPLDNLSPDIVLSSLASWKQIDRWAAQKFLPGAQTSAAIREKAETIIHGAASDKEKIERIFHFIQREVKYVAADLEHGGYTPHKAEEVLKNRYGDCKDQTTLFISMLAAVGIQAFPALINPLLYPERYTTPVPYFAHVITYIPTDGDALWLDTTPGVTPFPRLYITNQGRRAFIIDGRGGMMMSTQRSAAQENEYDFRFTVQRNGPRADASVQFGGKGAASDILKLLFISMNKEDSYRHLQSTILYEYKNAVIDSVAVSDVQNPETSFSARVYFHLDSMWTGTISRFTYNGNERMALQFFLNQSQLPAPDTRHYSLNLSYPYVISAYESYPKPSMEFSRMTVPDDDSLGTKYFHCVRKFEQTFSGVIARWSIIQDRTEIPLSDYPSFYRDTNRMKDLMYWLVTFYIPLENRSVR